MLNERRKLVLRLVPEDEANPKEPKSYRKAIGASLLMIALILIGIGAWAGRMIWPKLPSSLTPVEAARILHAKQGFAGYSLLATEGEDSQLRHDIFCPNCGTPIAAVNVAFLAPQPPLPGSRLALMTDLAQNAIAAQPPKKVASAAPKPVTAMIASK